MLKWFEKEEEGRPGVISSRIRLARNLDAYKFPAMLNAKESEEMFHRLEFGLKDLSEVEGKKYECAKLGEMDELDRAAMWERKILNRASVEKKVAAGIILSEDEDTAILLNGDDHIRIQLLSTGFCLEKLWQRADVLDDYINERFPYAFDEKYGYLTSFPTSVGTGMRASVVLHLPILSSSRKFPALVADMSRFGAAVRGVYDEEGENFGSLFEVSNQKTLGQSEKEIIDVVMKTAIQLLNQEMAIRESSILRCRLEREDEVYKSYGVLKYARRLTAKDGMLFLSQVMAGITDGILAMTKPCSIFRLIIGLQSANLQKISDKPLSKEDLDCARAEFLRRELPDLK